MEALDNNYDLLGVAIMKKFATTLVCALVFVTIMAGCAFGPYETAIADTLTNEEIEQIATIYAFMPADVWGVVREYNISYGNVNGGNELSFFDLETDEEEQGTKSSSASWLKLNEHYTIRINCQTKTDEKDGNPQLTITSIALLNKDTAQIMPIPEKLFPFLISSNPIGRFSPPDLLRYLPLLHVLRKPVQHRRDLCARREALRVELAGVVALDNPGADCPRERRLCVA
jgi:hypothetical protein